MTELEYKRSRPAILMQAQAIYMGFATDRLIVAPGLALADFPEISKYPDTERSKEVGAAICAALNSVGDTFLNGYDRTSWLKYFAQRCLELRPLSFAHLEPSHD